MEQEYFSKCIYVPIQEENSKPFDSFLSRQAQEKCDTEELVNEGGNIFGDLLKNF